MAYDYTISFYAIFRLFFFFSIFGFFFSVSIFVLILCAQNELQRNNKVKHLYWILLHFIRIWLKRSNEFENPLTQSEWELAQSMTINTTVYGALNANKSSSIGAVCACVVYENRWALLNHIKWVLLNEWNMDIKTINVFCLGICFDFGSRIEIGERDTHTHARAVSIVNQNPKQRHLTY